MPISYTLSLTTCSTSIDFPFRFVLFIFLILYSRFVVTIISCLLNLFTLLNLLFVETDIYPSAICFSIYFQKLKKKIKKSE